MLDSLVTLRKMSKWTEIVYLVVPALNDSDAEFRGLARWVKANLGADVPLHFTQFHPAIPAEEPADHARARRWSVPKRLPTPKDYTMSTSATCRDILRKTPTARSADESWWNASGSRQADADPQGQLSILRAADSWPLARVRAREEGSRMNISHTNIKMRSKVCWLVALLTAILAIAAVRHVRAADPPKVRPAGVAGGFYPADPKALRR